MALEDVVIGQYRSRTTGGKTLPGYLDDDTVPAGRSATLALILKPYTLYHRLRALVTSSQQMDSPVLLLHYAFRHQMWPAPYFELT